METLLQALRAAGEPTRLRLLALLRENELAVSELSRILGQSQPRVSRHLKLLCDAGLLDRFQEGSWVFYRLAEGPRANRFTNALAALPPADDPELARDEERLETIKRERAQAAAAYFASVAERWDELRRLYVEESRVEEAVLDACGPQRMEALLDVGTGTGRMLELLAPRVDQGLGIDLSREMLAIARNNLEESGIRHCRVRQGDVYQLGLPDASVDLVTVHQVLHFLDRPMDAIAEAARVLRPGGRLVLVDFGPHDLEFLRREHAHRRLGFDDDEIAAWCERAGMVDFAAHHLPASHGAPSASLTAIVWTARQRPDADTPLSQEAA